MPSGRRVQFPELQAMLAPDMPNIVHQPHPAASHEIVPISQEAETTASSSSSGLGIDSGAEQFTMLIPGYSRMPNAKDYDQIVPYCTEKGFTNSDEAQLAFSILVARLKLIAAAARLGVDREGKFINLRGESPDHEAFDEAKSRLKEYRQTVQMLDMAARSSVKKKMLIPNLSEWTNPERVVPSMERRIKYTFRAPPALANLFYRERVLKDEEDGVDPRKLDDQVKDLNDKMKYAYEHLDITFRYYPPKKEEEEEEEVKHTLNIDHGTTSSAPLLHSFAHFGLD